MLPATVLVGCTRRYRSSDSVPVEPKPRLFYLHSETAFKEEQPCLLPRGLDG